MFCEQCGEKIQPDAAFCGKCGAAIEMENETQLLNLGSDQSQEQNTISRSKSVGQAFQNDYQATEEPRYQQFSENHFKNPLQSKSEKQISVPLMLALGGIIVVLLGGIIWGVVTLVNMNKQSADDIYIAPTVSSAEVTEAEVTEAEGKSNGGLFEEEVEIKSNTPSENQIQQPAVEATPIPTDIPSQAESSAYNTNGDYIIADSSSRYITSGDLNILSARELKLARNEIYARHGRIFKSTDLDSYFRDKSWYSPSIPADQFKDGYLNSVEFENVKFIVNYEKEHGINQ